jgi:alpha-tubulin suppressor-like RCC1 family protein
MACNVKDISAGDQFVFLLLDNNKTKIINYNESQIIPSVNEDENNDIISISAGSSSIGTIKNNAIITTSEQVAGTFFSPRIISINNLPPGLKASGNFKTVAQNEIVYKENVIISIPRALTGLISGQGPLFKKYKNIFIEQPGVSGVFGSGDYNGDRTAELDGNNLTGAIAVSIKKNHALAILNNQKITGWGDDTYSKASNGNSLTGVIAVSLGSEHSLALLANNKVTGWGNNTSNQAFGGNDLTGVIGISAGISNSLALLANNKVTGWGDDDDNQTSLGNNLTGVIGISAGVYHSLALLANNKVTGWGGNIYDQALGGNNLTGVIAVSAGGGHSLALLANNKVTGWGYDEYGQALGGNNLTGVVNISAGIQHSLALLNNGKVTGWGLNTNQHLSHLNSLTGVTYISAGLSTNMFILKESIRKIPFPGPEPLQLTGNLTGFGITGYINGITGYTTQLVTVSQITGFNTGYESIIYNITGKLILPGVYNSSIVIDELGNDSRYVERYLTFTVPNDKRFPTIFKVCGGASLGFVDKVLT